MSEAGAIDTGGNPFSPKATLALVLFGGIVFVALLWMIGAGMTSGSANDGGSHAGGKGLNGYAAFAEFLEKRGMTVSRLQSEARLDDPGLLVLTPPQMADGAEIEAIVSRRRYDGPTLVVTPKWVAVPVPPQLSQAKQGWVQLAGTEPPHWRGFLDDVGVTISPMRAGGKPARWRGAGVEGDLPVSESVLSGTGDRLVPLVVGVQDGRILAAYVDDGGYYPTLEALALRPAASPSDAEDDGLYPIVLIFEPDLVDNYGMADFANAQLAERLVRAASGGSGQPVNFDLTLNGYARSANLLTLAFTPPFLAATLCLLMAAIAVGWRAFLRFGPPRKASRAIAFGKRALVANAAGLIRRTRRMHLVAAPYVAHARERIARQLALPRQADIAATNAAIDRAIAARRPDARPFSAIAAGLVNARRPHEVLKAAQELHALERTLTR